MAEIKNLKKAASRILKAVKEKEKIILYGDADLDGVTAVIILKEAIKNLGGETSAIYFPERETEGYGVSESGLNYLKKFSPGLLITLDCGIGNFKEMKLAKKYGFEVIIIDHHEILNRLPEADIIVDPKQKGDRYPFKELATVGISFKLSEILLGCHPATLQFAKDKLIPKMTNSLRKNFLELVAIATLADMMPQVNENKIFIEEGLQSLKNSWRPAIQAFSKIYELPREVSKIISILNVRDVENNLPASFRLLTIQDLEKAKELIAKLIEKSKLRREEIKKIVEEIEKRGSQNKEVLVFEGDSNWSFSLISVVASLICQKFKKPAFIFKKLEKESQGTVRVPAGLNSVLLMKKCKKYLITYGGHPQASGFRIKNENLEKFKECLIKNLQHR